jgi:hypothetical protein
VVCNPSFHGEGIEMKPNESLVRAFEATMASATETRRAGQYEQSMAHLERAHLIGQSTFVWHWLVHWRMLSLALSQSDGKEILGQLARLSLVPLGHLLGRLPLGNVGSTRMGAFATAELPKDVAELLADDAKPAGRAPS